MSDEHQPDWMLAAKLVRFWRRGWATFFLDCYLCGHEWTAVAAIGTVCASICPACGHAEETAWETVDSGLYCDGVWL